MSREKRGTLLWGRRKSIILLENSQAPPPPRPSDKSREKVKTLGWLEVVAWWQESRNLDFLN